MQKNLIMRYSSPAENSIEGWEKQSLPLGNGYMGASVFGRYDTERIQMTSNHLQNTVALGGTTSFADIFINFEHNNITDYQRGLDLNRGVAFCSYKSNGVQYNREYFTSYPDNLLAVKLTADKSEIAFKLSMVIPYLGERTPEEGGKEGNVKTEQGVIILRGKLCARNLDFEAQMTVVTDGKKIECEDGIEVKGATFANIFYVQGTNYKLCPEVFLEQDASNKVFGEDPHEALTESLNNALSKGYEAIYKTHYEDYNNLFSRVEIDLGGIPEGETDKLLEEYKMSASNRYIEELYYQFGRYLLISSSRKGTTPTSLQGVWSAHDKTPWSGGFWHNINIQMNYWPAFSTNLAETFAAYAEYAEAYRPQAENAAREYIKTMIDSNNTDKDCGWFIGTAATSFEISAQPGLHSGPGTVGLTSKLFWEYYDFTRDENILKDVTYPALKGASKFLTKCVKQYDDGNYRAIFSASPEQIVGNAWVTSRKSLQFYYHTVGCAFDQQMIYENGADFIKASDLLGLKGKTYETQKEQINKYNPVQIGYSGQVKEYEEENFYSEIGEIRHRHLSQLVALMPGTMIGSSTPAWLDAAKKTLDMRGDESTGWALAHRLCAWSRTGDENRAYTLYKNLLQTRTYHNLWDWHPPFQIDGNFGAVAGVTEMLMQSHEGYINILPTLPNEWKSGSFKGLKARGNFTVDCSWENGIVKEIKIVSCKGGKVTLRFKGLSKAEVYMQGEKIQPVSQNKEFITLDTKVGDEYLITNFETFLRPENVEGLACEKNQSIAHLSWKGKSGATYKVYCAKKNEFEYTFVGKTNEESFTHVLDDPNEVYNYKVTVLGADIESTGALITINPATELQKDRYERLLKQISSYPPQ